jgi:hypothetical protein
MLHDKLSIQYLRIYIYMYIYIYIYIYIYMWNRALVRQSRRNRKQIKTYEVDDSSDFLLHRSVRYRLLLTLNNV